MELKPGTHFEMHGKPYEYVGMSSASSGSDAVVRVGTGAASEALHRIFDPEDISARGERFWVTHEGLPYEEFTRQYDEQVKILQESGLIYPLSDGSLGFDGLDRKEHSVPSLVDITKPFLENPMLYKKKIDQGFNRFLLVPFGRQLRWLVNCYGVALLNHFVRLKNPPTPEQQRAPDPLKTRLFDSDGKPVSLNVNEPIIQVGLEIGTPQFDGADRDGKLQYYPSDFKSRAKTKEEILREQSDSPFAGWHILLAEDFPFLPDGGRVTKGRRIESQQTLEEFLTVHKDEMAAEAGMTPEDWIIYATTALQTSNRILGDKRNVMLFGAIFDPTWFMMPDKIPDVGFYTDDFITENETGYIQFSRVDPKSKVMMDMPTVVKVN